MMVLLGRTKSLPIATILPSSSNKVPFVITLPGEMIMVALVNAL